MLGHRIDDELELRLLRPWHAPALFALVVDNRAHLATWLPFAERTREVGDTEAFIRSQQRALDRGLFVTGIWWRERLVGTIGFNRWDTTNAVCEIGYWLAADAQGHGIITRATRACTDFALGEGGMNRVEIHTGAENTPSQGIPERLGFVREATLREALSVGEVRHDRVIFGMLASEWRGGEGS